MSVKWDNQDILTAIVNRYIREKFGTTRAKCGEGARSLAYRSSGRLRKARGFYRTTEHWWTVDKETGQIYDPTADQFGASLVPTEDDAKHYTEVDDEYVSSFLTIPDQFMTKHGQYMIMKSAREFGILEPRGQELIEERVSKKGDTYHYVGNRLEFSLKDAMEATLPRIRCFTVFHNDNDSYSIMVVYQTPKKLGRISNARWVMSQKKRVVVVGPEKKDGSRWVKPSGKNRNGRIRASMLEARDVLWSLHNRAPDVFPINPDSLTFPFWWDVEEEN